MTNQVYQIVTNTIIEQLEKGVIPWKKSWSAEGPKRMTTGKVYRGINRLLLGAVASVYGSDLFLTWNDIQAKNGRVRKGERGHLVVFYKPFQVKSKKVNDKGEEVEVIKNVPILRYSKVWNINQCDGIEAKVVDNPNVTLPEAEDVSASYLERESIKVALGNPAYWPTKDQITMPLMSKFDSSQEYYSTLFHEIAHSTGAEKRLNRNNGVMNSFGDTTYSKEELVAEIAACFLSSNTGIDYKIDNSVAYIQSWLKALRNDKTMVVSAASKAQKATDYVLGLEVEYV
jgi:antirestriction protein ArdC